MDPAPVEMPSWLDTEFLQNILRESTHDKELKVEKFIARPATSKGENYCSDLYRVEVSLRRGGGDVTTRSLIVKLPPTAVQPNQMVMQGGLFGREVSMYSDTLPRIAGLLGERLPFATALYSVLEPSPVIVLDDLLAEGYRMPNRTKGLDLDHTTIVLRTLGRYHAATVAILQKEPSLLQPYQSWAFNTSGMKESLGFFLAMSIELLAKAVESWTDVNPDYAARLRESMKTFSEKLFKCEQLDPEDFPVLTHHDFGINNMLFHYNDAGKVDDVKFVDFQLCSVTSPAIDLHSFLYTSLPETLRREHYEDLLREYHSSLCGTMASLGLSEQAPSFERIVQECERKLFYAMHSAVNLKPVFTCKPDDGFDAEAVLKGESIDPTRVWDSEGLSEGIKLLLPEFDKKGLF